MNLLKELQNTAKENASRITRRQDDLLDSVRENINMENEKDLDMIKFFGTSNIIASAKINKDEAIKLINGGFLSESDIKTVCHKYGLKCLTTKQYKNEVPLKALNDLRNFSETKDISEYNLYIIAPTSHFHKTQRPKVDPVLLYSYGNGMYEIVSTWGNDLNIFNRIKGVFREWTKLRITYILTALAIIAMWFSIVFIFNKFPINGSSSMLRDFSEIIYTLAGIAAVIVWIALIVDEDTMAPSDYSENYY